MQDKVKLPRETIEAIELMQAKGELLYGIVKRHSTDNLTMVNGWETVEALSGDTLIRALYIGYEVEQTPEDKVREMYELHFDDGERSPYDTGYNEGVQFGVKKTLELLGHKIDGVNT